LAEHNLTNEDYEHFLEQVEAQEKAQADNLEALAAEAVANASSAPVTPGGPLAAAAEDDKEEDTVTSGDAATPSGPTNGNPADSASVPDNTEEQNEDRAESPLVADSEETNANDDGEITTTG